MATNPVKKALTFTIRDFYKDYKKEVKETKFKERSYLEYRDFIFSVMAEIFHLILYKSWHFVMPYSLGTFFIKENTSRSTNILRRPFGDQYVPNHHTRRS